MKLVDFAVPLAGPNKTTCCKSIAYLLDLFRESILLRTTLLFVEDSFDEAINLVFG